MAGEIVTKSKRFYCVSIVPDICLTPVGPTMVPIPYIIIGEFSEATGVSPNITSNGEPVVIHASTVIPSVRGDEAGTGKGIKSGTVGGRVQAMEMSSTLSFNGERALRVGDLVYMNDKNTIGKIFERTNAQEPGAADRTGKQGERQSSQPGAGPSEALAALEALLRRAGAIWGEGETVAKKTVEFIPRAILSFVPGGHLLSAALSAATSSNGTSQSGNFAMPKRPSNAMQSDPNRGIGHDGGVSRGRVPGALAKEEAIESSVEFTPNDPLCTMPPAAQSAEELAALEKIRNGPQLQATSGDGLSPIQRFLIDSDLQYRYPIGGAAYGAAKLLGGSNRAADHMLMLGYSVEVVGGAATGGGLLRPGPIYVGPRSVSENASSGIRFGPKTLIGPGNAEDVRGKTRENESATILQKKGYIVEQNPVVPGRKRPDFRVNGDIYDNMAPSTSNPYSILTTAGDKVLKGQAPNIVINLKDSAASAQSIHEVFGSNPLPGGGTVIVIDKFENISTIKGK
jgi:hypothetical protein